MNYLEWFHDSNNAGGGLNTALVTSVTIGGEN